MNPEIKMEPAAAFAPVMTAPVAPEVTAFSEVQPLASSVIQRAVAGTFSLLDWLFGLASLVIGLAVLSVIPGLNIVSLGYLLHASGTVALTGRLRDGFVGIRKASILGHLAAGTWLVTWPVRIVSDFWKDAELIAPGGMAARQWRVALILITVLTVWHIAWACLRGGRLQHFLWPAPLRFWRWLREPKELGNMSRVVVGYFAGLRLPFFFWLGLRGFIGAVAWLILPVGTLWLASSRSSPGGMALLSLAGNFMLLVAVIYLPFLQTNFARTLRFRSLFDVNEVRSMFRRAPLAFWLALLSTLLFALPLYLLKIELPPRELAWLPSLVFVAFIYPARLLTGWAVSRAARREQPRHFVFRWTGRLAVIPVAAVYVLFVYLTQYLTWNGSRSLLEQHAFLLPAPLVAL